MPTRVRVTGGDRIAGKNNEGFDAQVSRVGELHTLPSDYSIEIARGNISGQSGAGIVGTDQLIGNTEKTIWGTTGRYAFQTSAQALEILSSSTADDTGGTGAITVKVEGLDSNYNDINETVTLDGTTAVDLSLTYLRINRMTTVTAGSGNSNAGTITLRLDGAGVSQSIMEIGANRSQDGVFTVPNTKTAFILATYVSIGKGNDIIMKIYRTSEGGVPIERIQLQPYQNNFYLTFPIPIKIVAKTDTEFTASSTNANTAVTVVQQLLVIDD